MKPLTIRITCGYGNHEEELLRIKLTASQLVDRLRAVRRTWFATGPSTKRGEK